MDGEVEEVTSEDIACRDAGIEWRSEDEEVEGVTPEDIACRDVGM